MAAAHRIICFEINYYLKVKCFFCCCTMKLCATAAAAAREEKLCARKIEKNERRAGVLIASYRNLFKVRKTCCSRKVCIAQAKNILLYIYAV